MNDCSNQATDSPKEIIALPSEQKLLLPTTLKEDLLKNKNRRIRATKQDILSLAVRRPKFLTDFEMGSNLERMRLKHPERSLRKVLRSVKTLKNLSWKLDLTPENSNIPDPFNSSTFLSKIINTAKHLPGIENLSLVFSRESAPQITIDKKIFCISKNMQIFKRLKVLSLNFAKEINPKDESFLLLLSKLKPCKELRTIALNFPQLQQTFEEDTIEKMFQSFAGVQNLSSLHINLGDFQKMKRSHLSCINKGILRLKSLSVLSLNLKAGSISNEFTDSDLELPCSSLLSHTRLTKVELNFEFWHKLTAVGLGFLGATLSKLPSLSSLTLDFSLCYDLTAASIKPLLKPLRGLLFLSTLDLSFKCEYRVGNDFVFLLASQITLLKKLKSLRLNFHDCKRITKTKPLSETLRKLTNLQDLFLEFQSNQLTDFKTQKLCLAINEMTNLKMLHLKFGNCHRNRIGDATLISLSSAILNMKQLTSLWLSFDTYIYLSYCPPQLGITNKGVEKFCSALEKMSSLRALAFNFSRNRNINNDSLRLLSAALPKLELLSELNLNFSHCEIGTLGMVVLTEAIESLKSLSILKLGLEKCLRNYSDEGFSCVVQTVKRMPLLKIVYLDFRDCNTRMTWRDIQKELWRIPELWVWR